MDFSVRCSLLNLRIGLSENRFALFGPMLYSIPARAKARPTDSRIARRSGCRLALRR